MIYLFTGDDAKNKILSYEKFIKSLPKGGDKFSVSRNNFDKIQIESLYSGSSLFSAKAAVIFSGILENEETRDYILGRKIKQAHIGCFQKSWAQKTSDECF